MGSFSFSLTSSTNPEDLVYRGNDYIVWDRVNAQRLKQGLPSLTDIGLPRPAEDAEVTGTTFFPPPEDDTDSVTIEGEGLTFEQAQEIFLSQNSAGSFVGLKPGQSINAGTQALAGLKSAQSQVTQALGSGISLDLPGADSLKQLQGLTAGLPVTDGINIGDIAKQAPAIAGLDQITQQQVTGALAQANKLVGQAAGDISNAAGVGKYGFDVPQLETAGYIKPGTAAKYIESGANQLTDVLKSPTVWTGKDNIINQENFLANPTLQDITQTDLMAQGVSALKDIGVSTDLLSGAKLAGTALVAAKGAGTVADWLSGQLPTAEGINLSQLARDGEFGANFAADKVSDAMRKEFPALPAVATVDRATLNAAAGRVLGNDKIPDLNFSVPAAPAAGELTDRLNLLYERYQDLQQDAGILQGRMGRVSLPEFINEGYDLIEAAEQLASDLTGIDSQLLALKREAEARDPPASFLISQIESIDIDSIIAQLETAIQKLRERLEAAQT